jgi:hypothetical protein
MRNLELFDSVITLHKIARLVEEEIDIGQLSDDIRKCADRLHDLSLVERKYAQNAVDVINQAKASND